MLIEQLTIFGPGLIGGSIALGARQRGLSSRVVVVDRTGGARWSAAERDRVADEWVHAGDDEAVRRTYAESSLIVLATPIQSIIDELPRALEGGAFVTDAGSTKGSIFRAAQSLPGRERFLPGHPMAGHPEGGLPHARADLFEDRRWLLCPAHVSSRACELVLELVNGLGARVVELDAESHDEAVAITSHLPQLFASALAALALEEGATRAAGPGFASATRVAGGPESVWGDIFATNGPAIAQALERLLPQLSEIAASLAAGRIQPALDLLARARAKRDSGVE